MLSSQAGKRASLFGSSKAIRPLAVRADPQTRVSTSHSPPKGLSDLERSLCLLSSEEVKALSLWDTSCLGVGRLSVPTWGGCQLPGWPGPSPFLLSFFKGVLMMLDEHGKVQAGVAARGEEVENHAAS